MQLRRQFAKGVDAGRGDSALKRAAPGRSRVRSLVAAGLLLLLAALLALPTQAQAQTVTTVPDDWALLPTGLSTGDQFRLIFLTSYNRNATSTAIGDYNTFVQGAANTGHTDIRAYSSGFTVVGCTASVDARNNTGTTYTSTDTGVPIYWLNGLQVADDYEDFYDGSWDAESNSQDKNELGTNGPNTTQSANYPFTGCDHDGTEAFLSSASRALGHSTDVRVGRPGSSGSGHGPIGSSFRTDPDNERPMYGLSAVFEVAAAVVPGAPTDLTATAAGETEIDLSWTAPTDDGGDAITGYKVEVSRNGTSNWSNAVADTASTGTTYSHIGLSAVNTRFYRVSAINSVGAGDASNVSGATTAAADVLVSNTGQSVHANNVVFIGDEDKTRSQGFDTGSNTGGYSLSSVGVYVRSADLQAGETFTVHIYTANGSGAPDALVHTLTSPASYTDRAVNTFTAPAGATLEPNTDYLVVFEGAADSLSDFVLGLTSSNGQDGGSGSGWEIENARRVNGGLSSDGDSFQVSVNGSILGTSVSASWSLIPSGLSVGDQFRLIFLSSTRRDADTSGISAYNTFVQGRAAAGHTDIQSYSSGFRVVGCTGSVDARDNTKTTGAGVPIYWLNGNKVADDYSDFYDGSWDEERNTQDRNESGNTGLNTSDSDNYPFTGCKHDGTEARSSSNISEALDKNQVRVGRPNSTDTGNGPISSTGSTSTAGRALERPMYGLSEIFRVVSDDATLSALAVNDGTNDLTLTPAFAPGTYAYAATVDNEVDEVTLTATVNEAGAAVSAVTLGGTAIADSDFTDGITVPSLVVGDNEIVVTVTAGVVTSTQAYTVTVTRLTDTTPPSLERADVSSSGTSVSVDFDEDLDIATQFLPTAVVNAFTVTADGVDLDIGNILSATLDVLNIRLQTGITILQGQTVTLSYNKTTAGTDALDDDDGNEVASFTGFAVTNNSTVAPTNSAPTFPTTTADRTIAENTASGQNVGGTFTATDSDGDTITYTLEGTDAASFNLVTVSAAARIQTKSGVTYNHEVKSSYNVTVKADDGNSGTDTITVTITITDVNEPPGQPAAPSVSGTSGSTTSLNVSWNAPDNTGPDIDNYDLQYRQGTSGGFTSGPQNVNGISTTIGSLTANTSYQVQVRATNAEGDSQWSPSGTGSTGSPPVTPPGKVFGVNITASDQTLQVNWTRVTGATGYKVQWKSGGQSYNSSRQATISSGSTTSRTISSLNNGTEYTVRVIATKTGASDGIPSDDANGTPTSANTVPTAPRSLNATGVGNTRINLSWNAPDSDGGSPITGYKIEVSSNGNSWTTRVANTGSANRTYSHTGLSTGDTRHYRVSAINSVGTGPTSNVVRASTGLPVVSIAPASTTEGQDIVFTVTISPPISGFRRLSYGTGSDSIPSGSKAATAGTDYVTPHPASKVIQIGYGLTSVEIRFSTIDDDLVEGTEVFGIGLYGSGDEGRDYTVGTRTVIGTIRDNDNNGQRYVDTVRGDSSTSASVSSGGSVTGRIEEVSDADWYRTSLTKDHCYRIGVAGSSDSDSLTLPYPALYGVYRIDSTRISGTSARADYAGNNAISYVKLDTSGTYYISVGVHRFLGEGTYRLSVSDLGTSSTACGAAKLAGPVQISVADVSREESESTRTYLIFEVTLNRYADKEVRVSYATVDGTARAGQDYESQSGTLVFERRDRTKQIWVPVEFDDEDEETETLTLRLSSAVGGQIKRGVATGSIYDYSTSR